MSDIANKPRHIAIIMDGNGRWAAGLGKPRLEGHMAGISSVRTAVESALRHGLDYLTLYVFSTENRGRPREEVEGLMDLFCICVVDETARLKEQGVRVRIIGDRSDMNPKIIDHINFIEDDTNAGDKLTLVLAFQYSSRDEIKNAVRKLCSLAATGETEPGKITEEHISDNLYTAGMPDPDLIIRTGGDYRLSNFLLWQSSYSELYFTETLWPDFDTRSFDKAVESFSGRERRFGLVSHQIHNCKNE